MIKNVIIPQKYGDYYIFNQTQLGFDITKNNVRVTEVLAKGKQRIIKKVIEEPIGQENDISYENRVSAAIKKSLTSIKKYDAIFSALPSSKIVFKELKFPFGDYDKIAAIVRFEVEQYLPFPIDSAYLDFIITDKKEKETTILVAAVKQKYIDEHIKLFKDANAEPQKITVDLFELYGTYKNISNYKNQSNTVCLIDLGFYSTRLGYITNGKLKAIRMINKGITSLAKTTDDFEHLYRFGLEEHLELSENAKNLLRDIQFSISSFSSPTDAVNIEILLFGDGASIKGIKELICKDTPYRCNLFNAKRILENQNISFKTKDSISLSMLTSVATALSSPETKNFNLMPHEKQEDTLLTKQIISASILLSLMLFGLGLHTFLQIRNINNEYQASEKQALTQLRNTLDVTEKKLGMALEKAKNELDKEEDIWFSLSPQSRISFLKYLEELSILIDRQGVGLDLKKISLTKDAIILEGSVKDYDALKVFTNELRRSQLFALETLPQDPNFKSIRLIIGKNGEEY